MINYNELIEIISKPWVDTVDIGKIACCGKHSATKIRIEIEQQILDSGKKLPLSSKKCVPTKMLLEYLGLDVDYIFDMASRTSVEV